MNINNRLILFFVFSIHLNIHSQRISLHITTSSPDSLVLKKIPYKKSNLTPTSALAEITQIGNSLNQLGFLHHKMNRVITDSLHTIYIKLGKQYRSIYITVPNDEILFRFLEESHIAPINNQIIIKFPSIPRFLNNLISYMDKKGYPFIKTSLKNIDLSNNIAKAELAFTKNKKRHIDKIIVNGYPKFPKSFLKNKLNRANKNQFYTDKLDELSSLLNTVSFVDQVKKPAVQFSKDSTLIYVYLKKKSSNQFDGLIGFSSNENKKGLKFEGHLDLKLINVFNRGETFKLYWKSTQTENKNFKISAKIPYLFNSPVSSAMNFVVFSKDTSYVNLTSAFNLEYQIDNKQYITTELTVENSSIIRNNVINNNENYKNQFYGIKYEILKHHNNNLFSHKYHFQVGTYLGVRKQDSTEKQKKYVFEGDYIIDINSKNSVFLKNKSELLESENYINNELFRIGGATSMRGFQEESVITSAYSIFNIEYRYLTSKTSYLYTISDYAYVKNSLINDDMNLFGVGAGYAFKNKIGILDLSYTISKVNTSPFNLKNNTLHIKLITFF